MFGITSYMNKIYEIKWKFNEKFLDTLEQDLYVEFKKVGQYYQIEKVLYSYVDMLLGLEDIDFDFTKKSNECIITLKL